MKNLKVIFAFLPVMALAIFIYFSSIGFSTGPVEKTPAAKKIEKKGEAKPSSTVMLWISLTDSGGNHCLNGTYTYCINGGVAMSASGEGFYIEVPCGEEITICVQSELCSGSWTGVAACDTDTFRIIDLTPGHRPCRCL